MNTTETRHMYSRTISSVVDSMKTTETRHTYSRTISSVVNGTIRSQILMTDFFSKANDTACVAHFTAHSMSLLIFTWDDSRVLACIKLLPFFLVPVGSPSRGGDVMVCVKEINQPSLPTPFHSVLVSISVSMALSTVFHFINSPDNFPFTHSVLVVLFLPYWSFQLYVSL